MIFPPLTPTAAPPLFVFDAPVAASWAIPPRGSAYTHRVQLRLAFGAVAIVATNWPLDLTEELLAAENRGQTIRRRIDGLFANLATYRIHLDERAPHLAWPVILDLARAHNLSVRDAAHLELALRLNLPLATTDSALTRAAAAAGVPLFTP